MELTTLEEQLPSTFFSDDPHDRSEGLHLSNILEDIEVAMFNPNRGGDIDLNVFRTMGFVWEQVIERILAYNMVEKGLLIRPGELKLDGIYLTPDGISVVDWTLEEWKCTWKSMRHGIDSDKFWRYWAQAKAYCKAIKSTRVRLRVFYVNGSYSWNDKKESGPRIHTYEAQFTQREIDENWSMITQHAKNKDWL